MKSTNISVKKSALKIALIYLIVASLWIFASDFILFKFIESQKIEELLSINKGLIFVLLTSVFLYIGIKNLLRQIDNLFTDQLNLERHWHFIMEVSEGGLGDWSLENENFISSPEWDDITGIKNFNQNYTAEAWLSIVHPDDLTRLKEDIRQHLAGEKAQLENEHRVIRHDGEVRWLLVKGVVVGRDQATNALKLTGIVVDITHQKKTQQELQLASIAFQSNEAKFITDDKQRILRINNAFTDITGYGEEVIGMTPKVLKSGKQSAGFYKRMWQVIREKGVWQGEIWNKRKNGQIFPEWLKVEVVKDPEGKVVNYLATFRDMSEIKDAERKIHDLSYFDPLTMLPNKYHLVKTLEKTKHTRSKKELCALIFIDLKNFKALNNSMGHKIGDQVLEIVAKRLDEKIKNEDKLARYGSDVFSALITGLNNKTEESALAVNHYCNQLYSLIKEPIKIGNFVYQAEASMGANLFHPVETSVDDVLKQTELAMLEAKKSLDSAVYFFNPSIQEKIFQLFEIESKLKNAVPHNLFLMYQPQINHDNQMLGAEVLVRWQDPEMGLISPAEFIPIAESSGLIHQIGYWVLETACWQLNKWAKYPNFRDLILSVNVSSRQFMHNDFIKDLEKVIANTGAKPSRLKLELTESVFVEDYETIISKMTFIKKMGFQISLDDFGTGFSSLTYLNLLPIDELKIDQSFVRDITEDNKDNAVTRTIISLGRSLDMEVIAEGVENSYQRKMLAEYGCNNYQGYLFSRPLKVEEFEKLEWLSKQQNH